jgi:hypothetical protein
MIESAITTHAHSSSPGPESSPYVFNAVPDFDGFLPPRNDVEAHAAGVEFARAVRDLQELLYQGMTRYGGNAWDQCGLMSCASLGWFVTTARAERGDE